MSIISDLSTVNFFIYLTQSETDTTAAKRVTKNKYVKVSCTSIFKCIQNTRNNSIRY